MLGKPRRLAQLIVRSGEIAAEGRNDSERVEEVRRGGDGGQVGGLTGAGECHTPAVDESELGKCRGLGPLGVHVKIRQISKSRTSHDTKISLLKALMLNPYTNIEATARAQTMSVVVTS
jgi:hypothetical protein